MSKKALMVFLLVALVGCTPMYRDISGGRPKRSYALYDEVWYTNRACLQTMLSGCRVHPSSRAFYYR